MKELDVLEELDIGMSNFDHTIDDGLEETLKAKPAMVYAQHSAWDFCGYVWFENKKFHEQIWRYHSPLEEIDADSLEDLMDEANSRYGYN